MKLNDSLRADGVLVIECHESNLDASNVRDFRAAMQGLMREQACIVLDMSRLKFVDSSGLGALIACLRDANSRMGDFRLAAMTASVRALFELMRMHRVFSIHESVDVAAASFA